MRSAGAKAPKLVNTDETDLSICRFRVQEKNGLSAPGALLKASSGQDRAPYSVVAPTPSLKFRRNGNAAEL